MCVPKYFGVEPCFLLNRNLDTANYKYMCIHLVISFFDPQYSLDPST
jgi:hypothetical protein